MTFVCTAIKTQIAHVKAAVSHDENVQIQQLPLRVRQGIHMLPSWAITSLR